MKELVSLTMNGTTYDSFRDQRAILFEDQSLTEAQKMKARENIGAQAVISEETYTMLGQSIEDYLSVSNAPATNGGAVTIDPAPETFGLIRSKNIFGLNLEETNVHQSLNLSVENSVITLNGTGGMAWYEVALDIPISVKAGGWVSNALISGTIENYFTVRLFNSSGNQVYKDLAFSPTTTVNVNQLTEDIEIATVKFYASTQAFVDVKCIIAFFLPQASAPSNIPAQLFDGEVVRYGRRFKLKGGHNAIMSVGANSIELGYYETEDSDSTIGHILNPGVNTVAVSGALGGTISNTLESIHQSYLAGADAVEIDLRLTSDGVLVLAHSWLLDGMADVSSLEDADSHFINDYTADVVTSLPLLNYSTYFTEPVYIPRFTDALLLCKTLGLKVWIDLKTDSGTPEYTNAYTYIDTAIANVKAAGMMDSVVFVNAYDTFRSYIREELPGAWIAVKTYVEGTTAEEDIAKAKEIGGNVVIQLEPAGSSFQDGVLTDERLESYHIAGYKTGAPYVPYDGKIDYVMAFSSAPHFPAKKFKNSVSHLSSEWASSKGTVAIEYSNSFGAYVIAVTDDRINWNEIARLTPQIDCYSSDITKTARAAYDSSLKKVAIALFDGNEMIDIQNFTSNIILNLVLTFC